jgi:hypothetical protein
VRGWSKKGHFIFLGGDISVYCDDLLGVFDIERTTVNPAVNEYLKRAQKSGGVYYCSLEMPKSFAVTDNTVFVSNVSVNTIKKRS